MWQGIFLKKWFDNSSFKRRWKSSFGEGKVDDSGDRGKRQSIHDFRRLVGIISREHVEFEEERMALQTSSMVAGAKSERGGGGVEGGGLRF